MKIQESTEMYLETIFVLGQGSEKVRPVDIAKKMSFSKPSVSIAMKKLQDAELIKIDTEGGISLTKIGRDIAERMYERHVWISNWLISLGVSEKTAIDDACKIEHIISEETFNAMRKQLQIFK